MDSKLAMDDSAKKNLEGLKCQLNALVETIKEINIDSILQQVNKLGEAKNFPGELPHRVIHLIDNPYNQAIKAWQNEFEELKEENERLKVRLELIDSVGQGDVTRTIDDVVCKARQVDELIQKVAELKNREEKILASFGKTSQDFRHAVYLLIGYRIDALRGNVYRLTHMYSSQERDRLSFKIEPHGEIKLIEDEHTKRMSELIQIYLKTSNSFPAFLAAITLHLFKISTQSVDMSITMSTTMLQAQSMMLSDTVNHTMNRSSRRSRPVVSSFGCSTSMGNSLSEETMIGNQRRDQSAISVVSLKQSEFKTPSGPTSAKSELQSQGSIAKREMEVAKEKVAKSLKCSGTDILSRAKQVEELSKKVKELKEREGKILDSFKKTSREFREVCYLLTGFRVEALKDRVFRLSSMYAEEEDDKLVFKIEDGEVQLLENKYTERLSRFIGTYLEEADSFPAFLAAITLDLFKSTTQSVDLSMTMSTTILPNPNMQ